MDALSIKNLRKSYGDVEALKGVSFNVKEGDLFALLGPNGAGKTTVIGIAMSLITNYKGNVKIFNRDITDIDVRCDIGLMPQEFNFSVFDPVMDIIINQAGYYGIKRKEALKRAEKYLKALGLWEKRNSLVQELSGGMKRKLLLVRALMNEPKLLILDEPTAGIDIETRNSIWKFIKKLNEKGTTIILTTHYLEEAENYCKNMVIMNRGKIIENTSTKKLVSTLKAETFILDIKIPIKKLPKTKHSLKLIDDSTIEATILKDENINDLFKELSKANIEVISMRNKMNRLEELFMDMTR